MITVTSLTTNGTTNASSANTASISPTANHLIILAVYGEVATGGSNIPTVTGASMTWTKIDSRPLTSPVGYNRITLFRSLSSTPGTGALTIDFASQTQRNISWSITDFDGIVTTGTNGSDAIIQSASNDLNTTATGITCTLGALTNINNVAYGVCANDKNNVTITKGANFALVSNITSPEDHNAEYSTNQTSVNWTWPSTATAVVAMAIEIKAQLSGGFFNLL